LHVVSSEGVIPFAPRQGAGAGAAGGGGGGGGGGVVRGRGGEGGLEEREVPESPHY
jgi:hypothetical protein